MEILFHFGAHTTDDGNLLRVLLKNRSLLQDHLIAVPPQEAYPPLLRAIAAAAPLSPAQREELLRPLAPPGTQRLVLSFESLPGFAEEAVSEAGFYPQAVARLTRVGEIFAGHALTLAFCLRNPATFAPAISQRRRSRNLPALSLTAGELPSWAAFVMRLRDALPGVRFLCWCDEDAPVIWHSLLHALTGTPESLEPEGALDWPAGFFATAPAAEAAVRMVFRDHAPVRDELRARILRTALSRLSPAPMVAAGLPGWSAAEVSSVTEAYDLDCARIARLPGVRFLLPPP